MNILLFLTPKQEVTLLYEDYTIGQALRSIENGGHPAVPIIRRSGSTGRKIFFSSAGFCGTTLEIAVRFIIAMAL